MRPRLLVPLAATALAVSGSLAVLPLSAQSRATATNVPVIPLMSTGATDMAQLRARGMQCYGIGPASSEDDRTNYGAHSDVERLLESSIYRFAEFTWEAVIGIAASR